MPNAADPFPLLRAAVPLPEPAFTGGGGGEAGGGRRRRRRG